MRQVASKEKSLSNPVLEKVSKQKMVVDTWTVDVQINLQLFECECEYWIYIAQYHEASLLR